MKKTFTGSLILLALVCIVFQDAPKQMAAGGRSNNANRRSQLATATVVFRGLMVFQPGAERRHLDVGVLDAPKHEFRIQLRESSPDGVSVSLIPIPSASAAGSVWTLESADSNVQRISFYQNGAFDRSKDSGDELDARWLMDLEGAEFYHRQLALKANQLRFVLRMSRGELYTRKRTAPLMRRKGDATFQYFGRVTEELATDVSLVEGDLVIRLENGSELLRLKQKPGIAYEIVIENAFTGDHHAALRVNHFRYYYDLLTEPITEKYEFRSVKGVDFAQAKFTMAKYVNNGLPANDEAPCSPIILGGGR